MPITIIELMDRLSSLIDDAKVCQTNATDLPLSQVRFIARTEDGNSLITVNVDSLKVYKIKRTDEEIDALLKDIRDHGGPDEYLWLSYEDGIRAMLKWLTSDDETSFPE